MVRKGNLLDRSVWNRGNCMGNLGDHKSTMIPMSETNYVREILARACWVRSDVPKPLTLIYSPRIRPEGLELATTGNEPVLNLVRKQ